jgi:MFS family permease
MAWFVFGCFIVFIACQAIGTGPACWLIPSEIFPVKVRGLGMGLSVAFNWGTNVVVAFLFPVILSSWGGANAFLVFLIIAVVALIYFYTNVPETKGVSLEQIEENLNAGKKMRDLGV